MEFFSGMAREIYRRRLALKFKEGDVVTVRTKGKKSIHSLTLNKDMEKIENRVGIIDTVITDYKHTRYRVKGVISENGYQWTFVAEWLERFSVKKWGRGLKAEKKSEELPF